MAYSALAAADPQRSSRLAQIPLEILIRITYFVSTTDLGNVRLSCKVLEQGLFKFFSHEFFRKKQFMITTASLQALVDISHHPTLSRCLRHVIISTERPKAFSGGDTEAQSKLKRAYADHLNLLATGGARDLLADAFACLTNLETVDIRDFNSLSRNRDGTGAPWRSYGSVTLARETEASVTNFQRGADDNYPSQLFWAATAALAVAGARPKSIEVLIRTQLYQGWALQDEAFYIAPSMQASMAAVLGGLKTLHLTLGRFDSDTALFQKFMSLAPNITWLRVNFVRGWRWTSKDILAWLGRRDDQGARAPVDPYPAHFPRLERLDLGALEIEASTLVNLAAKFAPTLTSLYLRRITLRVEYDPEHDCESRKRKPWAPILTAISRLPGSRLHTLDLGLLRILSKEGWWANVAFKVGDTAYFSSDWTCSSDQETMEDAVAKAVDHMTADWPPDPDPRAVEYDEGQVDALDDSDESDESEDLEELGDSGESGSEGS